MTTPHTITVPTTADSSATVPFAAHPGDAGHDLYAAADVTLKPGEKATIVPTGVRMALPDGYVAMVCPRSGMAVKTDVIIQNAPGIIDAGYRGEIGVIMRTLSTSEAYEIKRGDKIAQLVITPYVRAIFEPVDTLDITQRGEGGFGSTGTTAAP